MPLAVEHPAQQRRAQSHRYVVSRNSELEDRLQYRVGLHGIKLGTVDLLTDRLRQTGLQQFDRGSNAEQQRKWNVRPPGAGG